MSPTSCRCSTPRRRRASAPAASSARFGSNRARSARGGLASHGVAPRVLSGAAAGHDRVRDGTGWDRRALGHGRSSPGAMPGGRRRSAQAGARRLLCLWGARFVRTGGRSLAPEGEQGRARPRIRRNGAGLPSAMSTARLRSVARRPPAASPPGRLPGALPLFKWGDSSWAEIPA